MNKVTFISPVIKKLEKLGIKEEAETIKERYIEMRNKQKKLTLVERRLGKMIYEYNLPDVSSPKNEFIDNLQKWATKQDKLNKTMRQVTEEYTNIGNRLYHLRLQMEEIIKQASKSNDPYKIELIVNEYLEANND